jgi:hypothetical protein
MFLFVLSAKANIKEFTAVAESLKEQNVLGFDLSVIEKINKEVLKNIKECFDKVHIYR